MIGRAFVSAPTLLLLWAVLLASGSLEPACAQPATEEYRVKAAFLFHFAQLVNWPVGALNAGDQSINVCVFEDEPSLRVLQSTLEGKPIGTQVLHVRLLREPQGTQGCNILFLSREQGRRQAAVLRNVQGKPVLTVGETDGFLSDGGMIRLRLDQDKIRFDINVGSADASHLKISSRLLLLAATVTLPSGEKSGHAR